MAKTVPPEIVTPNIQAPVSAPAIDSKTKTAPKAPAVVAPAKPKPVEKKKGFFFR